MRRSCGHGHGVVGTAKTGTTTMRGIFGQYRAGHEVDSERVAPVAALAVSKTLDPKQGRWEMRRRNVRFGLEADSAAFLSPFVPQLRDLYPRAVSDPRAGLLS